MTKSKKELSFEQKLARLEDISEQLESDETSLEDSIKLFEEGVTLSKDCLAALKKAELKITKLKNDITSSINIEDDQNE